MTTMAWPSPRPVPLGDLAALLGLAAPAVPVTGASLDSRSVRPGDLYAALPGHATHGARFARDAVARGAVAVLTDPAGAALLDGIGVPVLVVDEPRARLGALAVAIHGEPGVQLLGVTGTNGKTTVASMVESGLRAAGRSAGIIGTIGVRFGDVVASGARTTPEVTDLLPLLAAMRDAGVTSVVMEVSSIALSEHRVDGLVYDVAAFTHLTQDHLDYHGTMEDYFAAKALLFTPEHSRFGLVGVDDAWGRRLAEECAVPHETWALGSPDADWTVQRSATGWLVTEPDGHRTPLDVPLPGTFNVANALCAFAMLRRAGVPAADAGRGIGTVTVPGRMQVVGAGGGIVGVVDYAHSPDAIERVLRAAREQCAGRVVAVLGAGGDRDRTKRGPMGQVAASLADIVIVTDDNPRSEDPAAIRDAILAGAREVPAAARARLVEEGDRARAVDLAVELATAGDMIVLLGKGHEQGQEVAGVMTPFDDADVLARALAASG